MIINQIAIGQTSLPQLNTPSISLEGTELTITNPTTNGNFTNGYKIYANGAYVTTYAADVVDLLDYIDEVGSYLIAAKCVGTNFLDSVLSSAVEFIVAPAAAPTITTQPQGATYNIGATPTALSIVATTSDGGTLTYQWYKSTDAGSTWSALTGATNSTYTPSTATVSSDMYRCIVTNTLRGTTATATSYSVTVEVILPQLAAPSISLSGSTLTITDNDGNATAFDIYVDGVHEATVQKA